MRKIWAAMDLCIVVIFVGVGRDAHAHGISVSGMASTAWPFLSGLAVGWLLLAAWRREARSYTGGIVTWLSTVAIGMLLRVISGQGIAFSFVLVALAFLGATMLGWRAVAAGVGRRRQPSRTGRTS